MPAEEKKLSLATIRMDGGTQPRAELLEDVIAEYAEAMRGGATFPPVDVYYDGTSYWLADGFHRAEATKKLGIAKIAAEVHQGTREDAQWHSCGANQFHGLRRSNEDKQRAVLAALKHPKAATMSTREIAEHCGVSNAMVSEYKDQVLTVNTSDKVTGSDGKQYPARHKRITDVVNNATGEVSDPADMSVIEEVERPLVKPEADPAVKSRGVGMERAYEAIGILKSIPMNDALRIDGFNRVLIWVKDAIKGEAS